MSNLTRYDLEHSSVKHHRELVPSVGGDWVKFDDIKELLNIAHNCATDAICPNCHQEAGVPVVHITNMACMHCHYRWSGKQHQ